MSIRLIARDLYRVRREVERLEEELRRTAPASKAVLEDDLRKTRAEMVELERMLDGAKNPPEYRRPR